MKVCVTGAGGMLGQDVCRLFDAAGIDLVALSRVDLDVTDAQAVAEGVVGVDWIINCAAYTRVDDAETDADSAYAVNAQAPGILAARALELGIPLLHVSTDYVFDGSLGRAMTEEDLTAPLGVYGASKRAGELAVEESGCEALIVRTQGLFGRHGGNFVATIQRLLSVPNPELKVVDDQITAPTWTGHLAAALLALVQRDARGVYHVAATGACSWHAFAVAIAGELGLTVEIEPVTSDVFPRPAPRPVYGVLDSRRYSDFVGEAMPTWEVGLRAYLAETDLSSRN